MSKLNVPEWIFFVAGPSHWSRVGARLPNSMRPIFLTVQNRNLSILRICLGLIR